MKRILIAGLVVCGAILADDTGIQMEPWRTVATPSGPSITAGPCTFKSPDLYCASAIKTKELVLFWIKKNDSDEDLDKNDRFVSFVSTNGTSGIADN
jgi:hypothetical protein